MLKVSKLRSMGQIQPATYFLYGPGTKNNFYIFKGFFFKGKDYAVTETLYGP